MFIRAAVAVALSLPALAAGQSLGEIARKTEESRKATSSPALKFDQRDLNPRTQDPELIEYRLDKDRWERLMAADVWTTQAMDRDPGLYDRVTSAQLQSVRSFERLLAREPEFVKALKSAGSDSHEFAYSTGATMLGVYMIQRELSPEVTDRLPPAIKANIEFMRAHMAEVQAMVARAAQLKARMEKAQKAQKR